MSKPILSAAIALTIWLAMIWPGSAFAERRVALVVGNSAYQHAQNLPNPTRDAHAMAARFKEAGFDVVKADYDVGNLEFKRTIREFEDVANGADIAVVYYAGHGIEIYGTNYLVPINAQLASDRDADDEAIPLTRLVNTVEGAKRLRLVILDACRDNPFIKMKRERRVATRQINAGLGVIGATGTDTLIAYAARDGLTAEDGEGGNSPFTQALLKHLFVPGLDVRLAFGRVRDAVLEATGRRQEPYVYGSLGKENVALVPAPVQPEVSAGTEAQGDYKLVERIGTKRAWEVFLTQYPTGFYADLARQQLENLTRVASREPDKTPLQEGASSEEQRAWDRIKDSGDAAALKKFIKRYPSSVLANTAEKRLEAIEQAAQEKEAKAKADREAKLAEEARIKAEKEAAQRAEEERKVREAADAERRNAERRAALRREEEEKRKKAEEAEREAALKRDEETKAKATAEAEKRRGERLAAERQAEERKRAEAEKQAAAKREEEDRKARATAEAERLRAERDAALKRAEAERQAAEEDRKQKQADATASSEAACKREEDQFAALQTPGSRSLDLKKFAGEVTCERLRPTVLAAVSRTTAEPAVPAPVSRPAVNEPAMIKTAQLELSRLGCLSGEADGVLGSDTKAAINRYLAKQGKPISDETEVTDELLSSLKTQSTPVCPQTVPVAKEKDKDDEKAVARAKARRDEEREERAAARRREEREERAARQREEREERAASRRKSREEPRSAHRERPQREARPQRETRPQREARPQQRARPQVRQSASRYSGGGGGGGGGGGHAIGVGF